MGRHCHESVEHQDAVHWRIFFEQRWVVVGTIFIQGIEIDDLLY